MNNAEVHSGLCCQRSQNLAPMHVTVGSVCTTIAIQCYLLLTYKVATSIRMWHGCWCTHTVTFEWNILLHLSRGAATKMFSSLMVEFLLQVLCQSTGVVIVQVIRGDEDVGDIPGVQDVQGGL